MEGSIHCGGRPQERKRYILDCRHSVLHPWMTLWATGREYEWRRIGGRGASNEVDFRHTCNACMAGHRLSCWPTGLGGLMGEGRGLCGGGVASQTVGHRRGRTRPQSRTSGGLTSPSVCSLAVRGPATITWLVRLPRWRRLRRPAAPPERLCTGYRQHLMRRSKGKREADPSWFLGAGGLKGGEEYALGLKGAKKRQ